MKIRLEQEGKFSGWAGLDSEDVLLVKRILEIELSRSQSRDLMSMALDSIDTSTRRRFEKMWRTLLR